MQNKVVNQYERPAVIRKRSKKRTRKEKLIQWKNDGEISHSLTTHGTYEMDIKKIFPFQISFAMYIVHFRKPYFLPFLLKNGAQHDTVSSFRTIDEGEKKV